MALFGRAFGADYPCKEVKIIDLQPSIKSVIVNAIVLEKDEIHLNASRTAPICEYWIADDTGSCILALFGKYADSLSPGDVVRLSNSYASIFRGQMQLFTGEKGHCEVIESIKMKYKEEPNLSAISWTEDPTEPSGYRPQWNVAVSGIKNIS